MSTVADDVLEKSAFGHGISIERWIGLNECLHIPEGLEFVGHTLEKLSLGIEYYRFNKSYYGLSTDEDEWAREQFHGFLKQFPRLCSAEVPITLLVGLDPDESANIRSLLPDTLDELCLQWDNLEMNSFWEFETQLHDCIWHLLVDVHSCTPRLRRVVAIRRLVVPPDQREYFTEERAELQKMCKEAGIDLEVMFDLLSSGLWTNNVWFE